MTLRAALTDFVARVVSASPTLAPRRAEAIALIDAMTEGWGERAPDARPYVSHLGRDGTPFEPSVRISHEPTELRWVIEAQPEDAARDSRAYFDAALALDARLAARGLVDLAHAERIADLFARRLPDTHAALWFGASLGASGPPVIKNYFVVSEPWQWCEALSRFGLDALAAELARTLVDPMRVEFVSVDLAGDDPRLKLYVRHKTIDPDVIDRCHATSPTWTKGDAAMLVRALFDGLPELRKLGPISTFHVSLAARAVSHSSLNVPLEPIHYVSPVPSDDAAIAKRLARLVSDLGLAMDPLYPTMLALAREDRVQYVHHRYAGLQRRGGRAEVTVYLSRLQQALQHGMTIGPVHLPPALFRR